VGRSYADGIGDAGHNDNGSNDNDDVLQDEETKKGDKIKKRKKTGIKEGRRQSTS
jgi:hypothetical protein